MGNSVSSTAPDTRPFLTASTPIRAIVTPASTSQEPLQDPRGAPSALTPSDGDDDHDDVPRDHAGDGGTRMTSASDTAPALVHEPTWTVDAPSTAPPPPLTAPTAPWVALPPGTVGRTLSPAVVEQLFGRLVPIFYDKSLTMNARFLKSMRCVYGTTISALKRATTLTTSPSQVLVNATNLDHGLGMGMAPAVSRRGGPSVTSDGETSSTAPRLARTQSLDKHDDSTCLDERGNAQPSDEMQADLYRHLPQVAEIGSAMIVKVYPKPLAGIPLHGYLTRLQEERRLLAGVVNASPVQRFMETESAGYVVRQFLPYNLYDRISTRPFLSTVEKKWIAYQCLVALCDSHAAGVCHGDLKTENVLLTSWNWVLLTDYASYKPTYLPDDNPTDFSYFFDTSSRRTCYVAPERFYDPSKVKRQAVFGQPDHLLAEKMDVFSLGCLLAELFLEGKPVFSLSQLLQYRKGAYDPSIELSKIEDDAMREMITHMVQLDPDQRDSAETYLAQGKTNGLFPHYFHQFLHVYLASLSDPGQHRFLVDPFRTIHDVKVERLFQDFDKIAYFLGFHYESPEAQESPIGKFSFLKDVYIPNFKVTQAVPKCADEGVLIILSILHSHLRHLPSAQSKHRVIEMMQAIGAHLVVSPPGGPCRSSYVLDRIIPYLVTLFADKVASVRIAAMKALTHLTSCIEQVAIADADIFPEYILFHGHAFTQDLDVSVRVAYAGCLSDLAKTSMRFLEIAQLARDENNLSLLSKPDGYDEAFMERSFDASLIDLRSIVEEHVVVLLSDTHHEVKRALLENVHPLCEFFGPQKTHDVVLTHMITFLNERDWQLRWMFFDAIAHVATFLEPEQVEQYVLPLMIQSLTDGEEFVVVKVIETFGRFVDLDLLLDRSHLPDIQKWILPLLYHPSSWIRYAVFGFMAKMAESLTLVDYHCFLLPALSSFTKFEVPHTRLIDLAIYQHVKEPLSRGVYNQAVMWAHKSPESFALNLETEQAKASPHYHLKDVVDDYWDRLRSLGLPNEDRQKIVAMKIYLMHLSRKKSSNIFPAFVDEWHLPQPDVAETGFVSLGNVGVLPRSIVLDVPSVASRCSRNSSLIVGRGPSLSSPYDRAKVFRRRSQSQSPDHRRQISFRRNRSVPRHLKSEPYLPEWSTTCSYDGVDDDDDNFRDETIDVQLEPLLENTRSKKPKSTEFIYPAKENYFQKFFEKKKKEIFLSPLPDIGAAEESVPFSATVNRRRIHSWKPLGKLVAHLMEHTKPIHQVMASPMSNFFTTCSSDGTVKIWDTFRLERNLTNRSRATYDALGSPVVCQTFCEASRTIAAASTCGKIHLFRMDVNYKSPNAAPSYSSATILRRTKLDAKERIISLNHFDNERQSVLVYATRKGKIHGWDLRSNRIIFSYQEPRHHGILNRVMVGPSKQWLMAGTKSGVFSCWDVRFGLSVRSWRHPSRSSIEAMVPFDMDQTASTTAPPSSSSFLAATGNLVSLWDVSTGICSKVFRFGAAGRESIQDEHLFQPEALPKFNELPLNMASFDRPSMTTIRSLTVPSDPGHLCRFFVSASSNGHIQYWNCRQIQESISISGDSLKKYRSKYVRPEQQLIEACDISATRRGDVHDLPTSTITTKAATAPVQSGSTYDRHVGAVSDVAIIHYPTPLVVSVGRDAVVNVWK